MLNILFYFICKYSRVSMNIKKYADTRMTYQHKKI